jgi:hypothetical protein
MSRLFGPMRQIAFVVRDIHSAMNHWTTTCGVGPWYFTERAVTDNFLYKGERYRLDLAIALANSGHLQLELIQPNDNAPSMFRNFLASGYEGMHHWCVWPDNYEELLSAALSNGWEIEQQGENERGRWVYFRSTGHPGTTIEVSEPTPHRSQINEIVRTAALNWDGTEPLRAWPVL